MKYLIIILALLSLTACGGSDNNDLQTTQTSDQKQETPAGIQIEAKTLHSGAGGKRTALDNRKEPSTKVMTTQADFEAELAIFTEDVVGATIDPSRQQVILVNAGKFGGIMREISLQTAYDTGKVVKVVVLHTTKGKNCAVADAKSVPYLFALVDTKKPIEIVQEYITKDCVKKTE